MSDAKTTAATTIHAEGVRVDIVTCTVCGAAILLDRRETVNYLQVHIEWHDKARSRRAKENL